MTPVEGALNALQFVGMTLALLLIFVGIGRRDPWYVLPGLALLALVVLPFLVV